MPLIYALYDPTDLEQGPPCIRYIGFTGVLLDRRLWEHVNEAKKGIATHRCNWIRSLLDRGIEPAAIVLEEVTAENWQEREIWWIAKFRAILTNATDGGEGLINPTQAVRDQISETVSRTLQGNQRRKGKAHLEADRTKIGYAVRRSSAFRAAMEAKKGVAPTHATEAARIYWTGRKRSPEDIAKMRQRMMGNSFSKGRPTSDLQKEVTRLRSVGNKHSLGHKHSAESAEAIAASKRGKVYAYNGVECRLFDVLSDIPEGWHRGRLQKRKEK